MADDYDDHFETSLLSYAVIVYPPLLLLSKKKFILFASLIV